MKKIIKLTESDLRKIIENSIKKTLTETGMSTRDLYYQFANVYDNIINWGEEIDTEDSNKIIEAAKILLNAFDDYTRHPDVGGSAKIWDNVGF
jgi:hypothetical protein